MLSQVAVSRQGGKTRYYPLDIATIVHAIAAGLRLTVTRKPSSMPFTTITTVLVAATSYDLTQLSAVKDELELATGKADGRLRRYIAEASAAAAQYCNRRFQVETVEDAIYPQNDPHPWQLSGQVETLQLSRWPVVQLVAVTENGDALVEGTDFRLDADSGALVRLDAGGNRCLWNALPKVVQYRAGYAGQGGYGGIPPDVEGAVIRMVVRRYVAPKDPNLMAQDIPGVMSQRWWIAGTSDTGNMAPDIADVLDNYRVPVLA